MPVVVPLPPRTAPAVDGGRAGAVQRAVDEQRAVAHRRGAAVRAGRDAEAAQGQRAGARLGERTGAADRAGVSGAGVERADGQRPAGGQDDVAAQRAAAGERADRGGKGARVQDGERGVVQRERGVRREARGRAADQGAGGDRRRVGVGVVAAEGQRRAGVRVVQLQPQEVIREGERERGIEHVRGDDAVARARVVHEVGAGGADVDLRAGDGERVADGGGQRQVLVQGDAAVEAAGRAEVAERRRAGPGDGWRR